jgi:DNA-binding SARP family transcriptional activator/tetratricopeptide (TPR) repeat protein
VEFRLLGPVEIHAANGQVIRLRRRQERLALAVLLLEPGRVVTAERLVEMLWEQSPPLAARTMLQTLMSRIRGALAAAGDGGEPVRLVARGGGYLLHIEPESVDLHRFGRLVDEARATNEPDLRSTRLATALDLWRGPALADAATGAVKDRLCGSLEELRFAALTDWIDAELDAGRHAEMVAELAKLTDEHPLRERLHGQLMTALYRAGRRADSLEAYRRARQLLVAELGVEPGPQLRALHASIIADTAASGPAVGRSTSRGAAPAVPAQLPPDFAGCVGREGSLRRLDALLTTGPAATGPVTCVVTGAAGVGKTTLVVHWAHRVASRYPDGQIFLDMRGFHTGPRMSPEEALPLVLVALGVPAEMIPIGLDAQVARYRSMVANQRLLLVLDNVADAAQVRPLLPGSPGCLVVLTSRDRLGGLVALDGARRLTLDVLTPTDALEVLAHVAGAERLDSDVDAAEELARLCAYLPLALRIAGARLADQPHRSVRGYVAELASAGRLAGLRVDDDDRACVRDAFGLSYQALSTAARRMFRLLSLVPTPAGLSTAAAAALADVPVPEAERMLDTIARLHLARTTAEGRYTCHDLLLEYAAELAEATDPEADRYEAASRLLDFYLYATEQSAAPRFAPIPRLPQRSVSSGVPKLRFSQLDAAREWTAVEWDNLVAGVRHAATAGPPDLAWRLVDTMNVHMALGEPRPEWRLLVETGLAVARREADPLAEAAMRYALALLCSRTGEFSDAVEEFKRALALYGQVGWRPGESIALRGSGVSLVRLGRPREATGCFRQALAIDREIGNLAGEAANLHALSAVHEELGELTLAERYHTEIPVSVPGRRQHPAMVLSNLGLLRYQQGRLAEALDALETSVVMFRDIGGRHSEGLALTTMGAVHRDAGRLPEATAAFAAALDIAHGTADAQVEVLALNGLSGVDVRLGRPAAAIARLDTALDIAERIGFLRGHVEALVACSEAHRAQGGFRLAYERAVDALARAHQSGSVVAVGNAHTAVADALLHLDDLEQCFVHARRALRIQRHAGQRLAQARTLTILGHAYGRSGQEPAAAACARQARHLSEPPHLQ